MTYRQNTLLKTNASDSTRPDYAGSYTVTVYARGTLVRTTQNSTTINVDAGHSFRPGDKYLINPGSDNTFSGTDTVQSVTHDTVVMGVSTNVTAGDVVVNLGADTGTATPVYDGSPVPIYTDADCDGSAVSNSRVTASAAGEYEYWYKGDGAVWELIRDGDGTVQDIIKGWALVQGRNNVVDYGMTGDGTTDDTDAGRAAFLADGNVYFPAATYLVAPDTADTANNGVFGLRVGREVYGDGLELSILKIKNEPGAYRNFLCAQHDADDANVDLSNTYIHDLSLDHNMANNTATASTANNPMVSIRISWGDDVRIERVMFKNASSTWMCGFSTSTGRRYLVKDCRFENVGGNPNDDAHDASMIYFNGYNGIITGNYFESPGLPSSPGTGSTSAETAIETHGPNMTVTDNIIYQFKAGVNATGVDTEDDYNQVISGNMIKDCQAGIKLYSQQNQGHTSGYGIDGFSVTNNHIDCEETGTWTAAVGVVGVTHVSSGWNLPTRNVLIANNVIKFKLESTKIATGSYGGGVVIRDSAAAADRQLLENIQISDNVIMNAPVTGIRIDCEAKNAKVTGNILHNCHSTLDVDNIPAGNRAAMIFDISGDEGDAWTIEGNTIYDNVATTRMKYGILIRDVSTSGWNAVVCRHNQIRVAGADTSAMVESIHVNASTAVLLYENFTEPYLPPTIAAAAGSTVYDSANSVWYRQVGTSTTWLADPLEGTATWDPGSLADGAGETKSLTVTGAALGDFVLVAAPYDLQDMTCTGYVQATNTVEIRLQNESGGVIDLASGTWRVRVIPASTR